MNPHIALTSRKDLGVCFASCIVVNAAVRVVF